MTKIKNYLIALELKISAFVRTHPKTGLAFAALITAIILWSVLAISNYNSSVLNDKSDSGQAQVSEDGVTITFPSDSPSLNLIRTTAITKGETTTRIMAPARVVLSVAKENKGPISVLFESSEVTSLYSQYRQSRASLDRAQKNLNRVRDMFRNQLATARELSDAEGEFQSAQAVHSEFDVKLRAEGFNPLELSNLKLGTTLVIADVPESQLEETKVGEQVNITLSSFSDKVFSGKVVAIGDIIDQVTRTVKVRVTLNCDNKVVRPGMFGKVDFGNSQNSVSIPLSSVVTVEEQTYVFVAKSIAIFERRAVSIVNNDSSDAIVLSGLSENENVVTSGAMLLKGLSFGY